MGNAPIKDVKCSTVPNVLLSAHGPNVTGNATNPPAPNLSANSFVKTPTVFLKLNAAHAHLELPKLLNHSPSLRKLKNKTNAANAKSKLVTFSIHIPEGFYYI